MADDMTAILITKIAIALRDRFKRPPTDEEVMGFIFGDATQRMEIWNYGIPRCMRD